MATKTNNVQDAASVVLDVEVQALKAILEAINVFDAALVSVQDTLPNNLTLDAARMISELRSQHGYRRLNELPAILNRYEPAMVPVMPAMYAPGTGPMPPMPEVTGNG
jgi:hypothetical protein